MSIADDLEKLVALRRSGSITEDEFESAKKSLLSIKATENKAHSLSSIFGRISAWYFAASLIGTAILTFQSHSITAFVLGLIFAAVFAFIGLGRATFLPTEKWIKISALGVISIFIVLLISLNDRKEGAGKNGTQGAASQTAEQSASSANINAENNIQGIMPVDVYLALEKEGFSTTKELNPCCTWYSSLGGNSPVIMTAQTHGNTTSSVYRINARVVTTIDKNTREVAKPFFGYLATLQYTGSKPEIAREWVEENIGKRISQHFGPALISLDHGADNALMMSITSE